MKNISFLKKLPNFLKLLSAILCLLLTAFLLMVSIILINFAEDTQTKFAAIIPFSISFLLAFTAYKCIRSVRENEEVANVSNTPRVVNLKQDNQTRSTKQLATYKVDPPSTPERTLESMRTAYDVNQIPGLIGIINDCIHIVSTSKNIDTVIGRLELGARKTYVLEQLEQIGLYRGKPTSVELIDIFIKQKPDIINRCLEKAYEDTVMKANELKTNKGKANRYTRFLEEVHKFDDDYWPENEEYIKRIEQELRQLVEQNN